MRQKILLSEMSWPEISGYLKENDCIIIPIGSIEEEGLHLPVNVDSLIALEIAKIVADRTKVIVAPLIPFGYSEWHMEYCGTISLMTETLIQVLREYCGSLISHGFRKLVFFNPHIGNVAAISQVGFEFRKKFGVLVTMANIWGIIDKMGQEVDKLSEKSFRHAGEMMTSMVLAFRPDLVDMTKAREGVEKPMLGESNNRAPGEILFHGYPIEVYQRTKETSNSGIMGNPTNATKENGEILINKICEVLSNFINKIKLT